MNDIIRRYKEQRAKRAIERSDGGPGSGNWGHVGRPGEVGGSGEGGGVQNRKGSGGNYTSFAKKRKEMAKPHKATWDELASIDTKGSRIAFGGKVYERNFGPKSESPAFRFLTSDGESWLDNWTGNEDVRVLVPKDEGQNYNIPKENKDRKAFNARYQKAFNPYDSQDADAKYRDKSGEVWKSLDDEQKYSVYHYTDEGYLVVNRALRRDRKSAEKIPAVQNMTEAISRSELGDDVVVHRAIDTEAFEKMFGVPTGTLSADSVRDFRGFTGIDDGFMSASTARAVMDAQIRPPVELSIMCPKGTRAMYVEPISEYGGGDKLGWDGVSKQSTYGDEMEMIIQRGSAITIIGGEYDPVKKSYKVRGYISYQRAVS